jgi:hypothetical protein
MSLTLLYNDQIRQVASREVGNDTWIPAAELAVLTGFEFKPEGACYGDVCIPLLPAQGEAIHTDGEVNLQAVAAKLGQGLVQDDDVISLGPIAAVRQRFAQGQAPDFDLVDREGQPVSLSLFADKKVILMTWASW